MENKGNESANISLQLGLATALLCALFGLGLATVFLSIPKDNDTAFNILLGNVMGWIGALVAFSFPSNIGTAKKDDTIKSQAKAAETLAATAAAPATITTTTTLENTANGSTDSNTTTTRDSSLVGSGAGGGGDSSDYTPDGLPANPPTDVMGEAPIAPRT